MDATSTNLKAEAPSSSSCFEALYGSKCTQSTAFKVGSIVCGALLLVVAALSICRLTIPNSHCVLFISFSSNQAVAISVTTIVGTLGLGSVTFGITVFYFQRTKPLNPISEIKEISNKQSAISWHSDQNVSCRPAMEDTHIDLSLNLKKFKGSNRFFGVFDGHGGIDMAEFVKNNIQKEIEFQLDKLARYDETSVKNALTNTFLNLDGMAKQEMPKTNAGSCGIVCLILEDQLYVANVGDSRVVWGNKDGVEALSEDDNGKYETAQKKLMKKNPDARFYFGKLYGLLAVTKAFGDWEYKKIGVSAEPEFKTKELREGDIVIIACDGLWDAMTNEAAIELAKQSRREEVAQALVTKALEKSRDNITVGVYHHKII